MYLFVIIRRDDRTQVPTIQYIGSDAYSTFEEIRRRVREDPSSYMMPEGAPASQKAVLKQLDVDFLAGGLELVSEKYVLADIEFVEPDTPIVFLGDDDTGIGQSPTSRKKRFRRRFKCRRKKTGRGTPTEESNQNSYTEAFAV